MCLSKVVGFAICSVAVLASLASAGPGMMGLTAQKMSQAMMDAKGWPPISAVCGEHDFYAKISSRPQEVVADCSVTGDIRGDKAKLKQCLGECCSMERCLGISARSTGTKLVLSFVYAHPDHNADSYMLREISQTMLGAEKSEGAGKSESRGSALKVSSAMMNMRGYPPMASHCGRHDFYGHIGSIPAAVVGDCSAKGDIRDDFHKLQRCLNECCHTDSCIGISSTANGTKLVQSFESAKVDEGSNSFMLHKPHELTAKVEDSDEAASESEEGSEAASESEEGSEVAKAEASREAATEGEAMQRVEASTKVAVAAAMQKVKSWPPVTASCGDKSKRYDFYGGIAGKASEELGECLVPGDIRKDYYKLKRCLQMCCNTDKCLGISASSSGTKLIGSFASIDEDEEVNSYMQH